MIQKRVMTLKSEWVSHYSLQINLKESNDCTTITKQHNPNKSHDCFSFCVDPKESHDCFYQQCIGPNESNVRNESHVAFFRHQRVSIFLCQWRGPSNPLKRYNKTTQTPGLNGGGVLLEISILLSLLKQNMTFGFDSTLNS